MLSKEYQIVETLHENDTTVVYRAKRIKDQTSVIIKMLKVSEMREYRVVQMMNERKLLHQLTFPSISHLYSVIATPVEYAHVFEDIGGISLFELLLRRTFTISEILYIALRIAETLDYLHRKQIIHADLNPKNIIYNTTTKEIQLIDFGYSFVDDRFKYNNDIHAGTSGNLMYMSPEQTGRTQQKLDFRSDLYSFGMTLYHLFTGAAPYSTDDRYDLIHKQIALHLPRLEEKIENFPTVLGALVEKLIKKSPNLRYQSHHALIFDLKKAIQSLQSDGTIEPFTIASTDRPPILSIGEIYGRDNEIEKLLHIKDRFFDSEQITISISGTGGIGKTRLVNHFINLLEKNRLWIVKGKFEQSKTTHPYAVFGDIFFQLKELFLEEKTVKKMAKMSPNSLQVLASFFPIFTGLGMKIAPTKPKIDLYAQLPHAVGELLRTVISKNRPMLIILDDVHWADKSSLDLMFKTIINENLSYVHLIFMYRDKELEKNLYTLQSLEHLNWLDNSRFIPIALQPLRQQDYAHMLQEWFSNDLIDDSDLITLLYKKTLGNPFYLKLLLENLLDSEAIIFNQGKWCANRELILFESASDDRNDLIRIRLERLNSSKRDVLFILALLGNKTEIQVAQKVLKSMRYAPEIIDQLDVEGLIDVSHQKYTFVHNLLSEYLSQTIPAEKEREFQILIGKQLYRLYRTGIYRDVVQMSYFLNTAYPEGQRLSIYLRLNFDSLATMLKTHEYTLALKRLTWMEHNDLDTLLRESKRYRWEYGQIRFKILYLNGLHQKASLQINRLLSNTKNVEEEIVCFSMLKDLSITWGKGFERTSELGERILKKLGLSMVSEKLDTILWQLNSKIEAHPSSQNIQKIVSLPIMQNPSQERIVSMLVEYWQSVYYLADVKKMQWAYLNIIDLSFRYGNTSGSSFGYVLYGAGLISSRRYRQAYRFGDAALKINYRFGDTVMLTKVHSFMANFISPYVKGVVENVSLYQKSLNQSKINGDIIFGIWANYLMYFSQFFAGTSLDTLRTNMDEGSGWLLHSKDQKMIAMFRALDQTVALYQQPQNVVAFDEVFSISLWEDEKFYPGLAWYGILKAQEHWFAGDFDLALGFLEKYVRIESNEVIMFPKQYLHIYRCLILLAKTVPLSSHEQKLLEGDLVECDTYAKASPQKFKFWQLLIQAKSARGIKNIWKVAQYFDEAGQQAREQNNPMYIAIAGMCTARFWKSKGYEEMSRFYFNEASIGFNQWGAFALALRFRPMIQNVNEQSAILSLEQSSSSSMLRSEPANLRALLKAFYTLSQSIGKKDLLQNLMNMIMQNATASKAVVILYEGDQYYVKASMQFQESEFRLYHQQLIESDLIPYHIINHAIYIDHKVVVDAPAQNGRFQHDEYFKRHKPASCSAFAAFIEGEVRAVLYLENNEVSTPLNEETIHTLRLLLTQAGIIYKNAALYEMLQNNEFNLNKAQQLSHVGSFQYNMTTDELVWSAETYRIFEVIPFSIDISQGWVMGHIHPDDLPAVLDEQEKILSGQPYCDMFNRIITAKGNIRSVHQRAEIYWEEKQLKLSGTIQDITGIQQSEAKIEMLSQVVNQTPFAVILTDGKGKIEYANNQALEMTGYFLHELIGEKMSLFNSGIHTAAFYTQLWDTIAHQRKSWRGTIVNQMKNGVLRDCYSTIFPIIGAHGEIVNFVTIQDDVTERNLKDRLFIMQTRQAQMGEMLSMIAHQWRQPLAIMSALIARQKLNILLEQASYDEIGQNFNEMETQIQYLSRTITDFKDFFKPDKQTSLTSSTLIITKALALIEHTIMTYGIIIEKHLDDMTEFHTYESELIQVVLNLIKNSLDAFDEKPIQHPKITVTTVNEGINSLIHIEDNAGGIAPEIMETLFSPYVSTKADNGTGLGLYMSKIILEEHCHGNITAINTSQGARFTLEFSKNHLI